MDEEASDSDNDDDMVSSDVILSVSITNDRLGAAYYDRNLSAVFMLEDIAENAADCGVLEHVIDQVKPTTVVASFKQDDRVLYNLKRLCRIPETEDQSLNAVGTAVVEHVSDCCSPSKPELYLVHSSEFDFVNCQNAICAAVNGNSKVLNSELQATFVVNFQCVNMVRSLGALIRHCNLKVVRCTREAAADNGYQSGARPAFTILKTFTLENILKIDEVTYQALQIFKLMNHPSVYKAGSQGLKEGFSLFSLFSRCRSVVGALELRRWFLRPLSDQSVLKERLKAVNYFFDSENAQLAQAMRKQLQNVKRLTNILTRMQLGKVKPNDWISLYKTVYSCIYLQDLVRIREHMPELLTDVNFQQMKEDSRFVVNCGIDEELDSKRQLYANLPDVLTDVAREEINKLSFRPPECSVLYLPMIGYLFTIPSDPKATSLKDYIKPGLEFIFLFNNRAHYKSPAMRRLDEELGDLKLEISDREKSIMINLQNFILDQAPLLIEGVNFAAKLDCVISMAMVAQEFNWRPPDLVEDNILDIDSARHPLQELCVDSFISNPIKSGPVEFGRVHLLTGPNASGKSVYLKQVGLIIFLAHIGSFVPAIRAKIGPIDRIFTRVHTVDTVLNGMSTFANDVKQLAVATMQATSRSLVIVDEFGKGTLSEVGLSLLTACLEYWLKSGDQLPHVFASSHLHSLLKLMPETPFLKLQTMEVIKEENNLTYIYQVVDGSIECSYAAYSALQAGLSEKLVKRAYEVYENMKNGATIQRSDSTNDQMHEEYCKIDRLVTMFLNEEEDSDKYIALLNRIAGENRT